MDIIDFYLFLEQEKRRKYQPLWHNLNLLADGRTIQIWGPGHWKMRCPFAGDGHRISQEDIVEGIPTRDGYNAQLRVPLYAERNIHVPLYAVENIKEVEDGEIEGDPRMQQPQANPSQYERIRNDDPDDEEWYDEEDTGFHFHEELLQQNKDDEDDSHMYQDAHGPNDAEDSQNEDSDINSPCIPRQYLNEV